MKDLRETCRNNFCENLCPSSKTCSDISKLNDILLDSPEEWDYQEIKYLINKLLGGK